VTAEQLRRSYAEYIVLGAPRALVDALIEPFAREPREVFGSTYASQVALISGDVEPSRGGRRHLAREPRTSAAQVQRDRQLDR
jgi:hypothetical protein